MKSPARADQPQTWSSSMARRNPQTQAKRERELAKARKRQDKIARRQQRKALREEGASEPASDPQAERQDTKANESGRDQPS
jgi:hypothetical protein